MAHEKSAMVKMRVKVSVLATIDAAAKQAAMNRSRFLRAAALAFDPEPISERKPPQPATPQSRRPVRAKEPELLSMRHAARAAIEPPSGVRRVVKAPVERLRQARAGCPVCGAVGGTHQKGCARG